MVAGGGAGAARLVLRTSCHFHCSVYHKLRVDTQLLCRYFWVKNWAQRRVWPKYSKITHFERRGDVPALTEVKCRRSRLVSRQGVFDASLYVLHSLDENGTILKKKWQCAEKNVSAPPQRQLLWFLLQSLVGLLCTYICTDTRQRGEGGGTHSSTLCLLV